MHLCPGWINNLIKGLQQKDLGFIWQVTFFSL